MPIQINNNNPNPFLKIVRKFQTLQKNKKLVFRVIAEKVLEEYQDRIFNKGLNSYQRQIGIYQSKTRYFSINRMIKPKAGIKNPKAPKKESKILKKRILFYQRQIEVLERKLQSIKFQSELKNKIKSRIDKYYKLIEDLKSAKVPAVNKSKVRTSKSIRLEGGYKEFRQIQGLPYQKVNLEYSGFLRNAFSIQQDNNGFLITLRTKSRLPKPFGYKKTPNPVAIAKRLERKYGVPIFNPTPKEIQNLKQIFIDTIKEAITQ
jgi:hypothetical protein